MIDPQYNGVSGDDKKDADESIGLSVSPPSTKTSKSQRRRGDSKNSRVPAKVIMASPAVSCLSTPRKNRTGAKSNKICLRLEESNEPLTVRESVNIPTEQSGGDATKVTYSLPTVPSPSVTLSALRSRKPVPLETLASSIRDDTKKGAPLPKTDATPAIKSALRAIKQGWENETAKTDQSEVAPSSFATSDSGKGQSKPPGLQFSDVLAILKSPESVRLPPPPPVIAPAPTPPPSVPPLTPQPPSMPSLATHPASAGASTLPLSPPTPLSPTTLDVVGAHLPSSAPGGWSQQHLVPPPSSVDDDLSPSAPAIADEYLFAVDDAITPTLDLPLYTNPESERQPPFNWQQQQQQQENHPASIAADATAGSKMDPLPPPPLIAPLPPAAVPLDGSVLDPNWVWPHGHGAGTSSSRWEDPSRQLLSLDSPLDLEGLMDLDCFPSDMGIA